MTPRLIGRDHPAALLRGGIDRVINSHGGLVLVTGEAGIGKTALVTWAANEARRSGALVLSGSCWDSESAPGYWPWVQVIRGLRRNMSEQEWRAADRVAGGGLAVLFGERPGDAPDGFQLYDAVTTALVSASQRCPVVVVLDDLHWADAASLRLLEFAAQHTWFERLLLVGTYRDVEMEQIAHPMRPLLLPLVARATTVTLTGLGPEDVHTLMARTGDAELDPALVAEVHQRTGGNPFFDFQIPAAVITLKQGFGRLIRSMEDRGVLVLLDPRLQQKRYGKVFLDSLPRYRVTQELGDVEAFFA